MTFLCDFKNKHKFLIQLHSLDTSSVIFFSLRTIHKSYSKKNGDAASQAILGNLLYRGVGVDQGFKEAVKWYRLAAEQDFAEDLNLRPIAYEARYLLKYKLYM